MYSIAIQTLTISERFMTEDDSFCLFATITSSESLLQQILDNVCCVPAKEVKDNIIVTMSARYV